MKNLFGKKSIARALAAAFFMSTFSLFGVAPTASAAEVSKDFEFGAGTANSTSNFRTFYLPSGLPATARVTVYRLGDAGAANDVPIVIELRHPGTSETVEGPIVAQRGGATDRIFARRDSQTFTLNGPASAIGCSIPWRVRVRPESGQSPVAVKGTITVSFNTSARTLTISPVNINLPKGNRVTKTLSGITGSGTVRLRAEWHTSPLELLHINSYYQLTFRLKRNGVTVASQSGFSQHAPADKTPKLSLVHYVSPEQAAGATWTLEIESFAPADIVDLHINESGAFSSTFTPGCN